MANFPDPAFLAALVSRVKVTFTTKKNLSVFGCFYLAGFLALAFEFVVFAYLGGIPSQQLDLGTHMAMHLALGVGFSMSQPTLFPLASQGMNNYAVPLFVSSFMTLPPADTSSVISHSSPVPAMTQMMLALCLLACHQVFFSNSPLLLALGFPWSRPRLSIRLQLGNMSI